MKRFYSVILLLMIASIAFGCTSNESSAMPINTQTFLPSSTPQLPITTPAQSATSNPSLTPTITLTPLPALNPTEVKETIKTLLQNPVDCMAPCFWNITPGKSTLNDSLRIFTHFGLKTKSTTFDDKEFYGVRYDFDKGLSILVTLTIKDKVVENLRVDIHPEKQKAGVPREWPVYSPEALIKRYGLPTSVEFSGDRGGAPLYVMIMYFDNHDLIVEYESDNLGPQLQICPLADQIDLVRIWMGPDPQYPPFIGTPLDKATSITMEEFAKLLAGSSNESCFNLNEEVFP